MEAIKSVKAQGEALGYKGDALRAFIKDQLDRLSDERQEQRIARERERLINLLDVHLRSVNNIPFKFCIYDIPRSFFLHELFIRWFGFPFL